MTHERLSRPNEPLDADLSEKVNEKPETRSLPRSGLGKFTEPLWFNTHTDTQC